MGSITTVTVGRNAQPLAAAPVGGAAGGQVLIINLDAANTVNLGSSASQLSFPLPAGAQITLTAPVWAAAATEQLTVGVAPGGGSYFLPASLSDLGGIAVYIQAGQPTGNPPVNSIWLQTSSGVVTGFWTWSGTAWIAQVFNASEVLAVGTIVANLIAAGTIVAGIVNGTTITGAQLVGDGAGNEVLVYTGTPALGNLIATVSAKNDTDTPGNTVVDGVASYGPDDGYIQVAANQASGQPFLVLRPPSATHLSVAPQLTASAVNPGTVTEFYECLLASGEPAGGPVQSQLLLFSENENASTAAGGELQVDGTAILSWFGNAIQVSQPISAGTWQSLGALSGTSGYTVTQGRYMLTIDGFYEVDVVLTATATAAAGTYTFAVSLPVAPLNSRSYPLGYNGAFPTTAVSFPSLRISGVVAVQVPALPTNTVLSATQRFPVN